ncbi:50S ribosomal protein L13 [Candidatus Daviesbacteria bacterium]|nr:50S ribosomal protein L13 [Candidatus Daviesbacteria bacterium]
MSTNVLSAKDIKRNWHLVDVKGKILGRVATEIATILSGKKKAQYVPYLDTGDFVVVTNAKDIKVTGRKMEQKKYVRHSGYPGGLKVETFSKLQVRRPEEIIRHAVKGMLPKNRLGVKMIKKLHVFAGSDHPFKKQLGVEEK